MAGTAGPAWAAFSSLVQATGSFSAYTVPVPPNLRCTGLGQLRGRLMWNPATAPPDVAVSYVVTQPDGREVVTAATSYALPAIVLVGQYSVRTRVGTTWLSAASTRTVTNIAGIYICS